MDRTHIHAFTAAMQRKDLEAMLTHMADDITLNTPLVEFRPVNAQIAAFAILGMCNWTAWWFSPSGKLSHKEVAEQVLALALASVQNSSGTGEARDLRSLVASIRENLDLIDLIHPA